MADFKAKCDKLYNVIDEYCKEDIIVAFSGGVDSSLILKIAADCSKKYNKNVYAYTISTKLHPVGDLEIARNLAENMGAIHKVLTVDELESADITYNPEDRCYRCKKFIFSQLIVESKALHIDTILDGTNEDDMHVYRPGVRALIELGVKSPLRDVLFSKDDVRRLANELGISVANRPSTPCMATRFPYGSKLDYNDLKKVDDAESFIRNLGYYNVRVRVHRDIARIEIDINDMDRFLQDKDKINTFLKELGYTYITLDLEGFRSGSMDYYIDKKI